MANNVIYLHTIATGLETWLISHYVRRSISSSMKDQTQFLAFTAILLQYVVLHARLIWRKLSNIMLCPLFVDVKVGNTKVTHWSHIQELPVCLPEQ